jgi:osmotically-inducible protein OsmY
MRFRSTQLGQIGAGPPPEQSLDVQPLSRPTNPAYYCYVRMRITKTNPGDPRPQQLVLLACLQLLTTFCPRLAIAEPFQVAAIERPSAPRSQQALAGPVSADEQQRQAVLRKLRADRHLASGSIAVAARSGIVELGGTVDTLLGRGRAAQVASAVSGVRGVVNRVRFVPVHRPDSLVTKEVREALRSTPALANMPIRVRVADGVVALLGSISTWQEQQLAERVVTSVAGVRFCQNQLRWSKLLGRNAEMIAADVRSRLDWDPLVQHSPIRVLARGGQVFLHGTTGSVVERSRAVELAWVKGVRGVDANRLAISATSRPDSDARSTFPSDREILSAIQDLAAYWSVPSTSSWSATVSAGVVTLRGSVATLGEEQTLIAVARSAVGVADVRSELRGPWQRPTPSPAANRRRKAPKRR